MKNIVLFVIVVMALTLAACSPNTAPTPIPTIVLGAQPGGSSASGNGAEGGSSVSASGEIVPDPKAQLSFPLTGTVKTVEVQAGDKVTVGQTLVTLDTALWEARIKEAKGDVAAAEANERLLVRNGDDQEHIDAANAELDRAKAALEIRRGNPGASHSHGPIRWHYRIRRHLPC